LDRLKGHHRAVDRSAPATRGETNESDKSSKVTSIRQGRSYDHRREGPRLIAPKILLTARHNLRENLDEVSAFFRNSRRKKLGVGPALDQYGLLKLAVPFIESYVVMSIRDCDSSFNNQLLDMGMSSAERVVAGICSGGEE